MKSRITTRRTRIPRSAIQRPANQRPSTRSFALSEPHRAAAEARAMLRHPRSLIRITPGWQAPRFTVEAGDSTAMVHVSRRRMTPLLWRRLSGQQAPEGQDLFLVTVSVECPQWMHNESTRLLEFILGQAWTVREDPQEFRDRNHQAQVSLTWHALMTQEDLQAGKAPAPRAA